MKRFLFGLVFCFPVWLLAQIGGQNVYDFVNLTPAARTAALGGTNITTFDHDANMAYQNPALVNDSMHQQVGLSIVNFLGGITYGYASYAHSVEDIADFHGGIQYVNYGKMIQADVFGNQTGNFSANDIALVAGASRVVDAFRLGANLKFINSSISGFQSHSALALDLGGLYVSDNGRFTAGMVFRNMGFNLTKWNSPSTRTNLPFDIQ